MEEIYDIKITSVVKTQVNSELCVVLFADCALDNGDPSFLQKKIMQLGKEATESTGLKLVASIHLRNPERQIVIREFHWFKLNSGGLILELYFFSELDVVSKLNGLSLRIGFNEPRLLA